VDEMKKKWPIVLLIIALGLIALWRLGLVNRLLASTVFSPNYDQAENQEVLDYDTETIAEDIEIPWEIVKLSETEFLFTERRGNIALLEDGNKNVIHTIDEVEHVGEGGLLGMTLSPDFESNSRVFVYYTYRDGSGIWNKVSSFAFDSESLTDERVIIERIPGNSTHNGGRIKFGPDDKLYITTGDAQDAESAQDLDSLAGKILRLNEDGSFPQDNPFPDSLVYAYGLRNSQGLSWNSNGELYASDHGPSSQDEINRILPGKNYGWPRVTCEQQNTEYEDPIVCYSDFTMAPSGIAFSEGGNGESHLYIAGLRGNMLMKLEIGENGKVLAEETVIKDIGRIRTVIYEDDSLYIATNNTDGRGIPNSGDDKIIKILLN
jgi:aldose sugar dehydrogenase